MSTDSSILKEYTVYYDIRKLRLICVLAHSVSYKPGPKIKLFFVLVLRLVLRTQSLCFTEYDIKNRGYKSFGARSPLSWIWSTYSNIITYDVARDCFKNARKNA